MIKVTDFIEGKFYRECNGTLFKLYRGDIWNSADGINWRRSAEVFPLGFFVKEFFEEVKITAKVRKA